MHLSTEKNSVKSTHILFNIIVTLFLLNMYKILIYGYIYVFCTIFIQLTKNPYFKALNMV